MTTQHDSNTTGFRHLSRYGFERWAAGNGMCRTVKDRLGVKGPGAHLWGSR
jgi:hypothetical protein